MAETHLKPKVHEDVDWRALIPEEDWEQYCRVLEGAEERGIQFAVGGGLAFSAYSRRVRNTKDMDLLILPRERDAAVDLLIECGFSDLFEAQEYDRSWIYRGHRGNLITDLIWTMPNHRMDVDGDWLTRGAIVNIRGMDVRMVAVEELIWSKLYVMQRDRCDWPDLLNVLDEQAASIDWERLVAKIGADRPLLGGLLGVYRWLCQEGAQQVPPWVWERVGLRPMAPTDPSETKEFRARLLDTRSWLGPNGSGR